MGQLEDMQVFIRVVESGGVGRAAEQLGIAKSAVSRRLSELEKRLGTRLINRTTRISSLTESGNSYYRQAIKVVDQVNEINNELVDAERALNGSIRLAAPLSFGLLHLGPAIDVFIKQNPEINIYLDFSDRQVDLIEEGFDLALRIAELKDSSIQARRICPAHHTLLASPAYLSEHGEPRKPGDLRHHSMLKYDGGVSHLLITDPEGTQHDLHLSAKIEANNGDFLLQMACADHGIVMLPTFITWTAVAAGELVQVLPDCSMHSPSAYFVYPQNRYVTQRVRRLIDFMVERFGDRPYWDQTI
jgi:DNA-binding transcriptional LysR family regulator